MILRYELKYAVDLLDKEAIMASILTHPASFTKVYPDRQVNNIYLDTPTFHCFHQNVEGDTRRKKMRLRWYGDHPFPTPKSTLEIKNKNAELGWKDSFKLDGSTVTDMTSLKLAIGNTGHLQSDLTPTLHNSYHRSYYISQDGLFRITIDTEQSFKIPFSNMSQLPTTRYPIIVELKFDQEHAPLARSITDYLPFRQTKNSKYVTGVTELWF